MHLGQQMSAELGGISEAQVQLSPEAHAADVLERTRETIGNLATMVGGAAGEAAGGKFAVRTLVFGHMADAAKGIKHFCCVTDKEIAMCTLKELAAIEAAHPLLQQPTAVPPCV